MLAFDSIDKFDSRDKLQIKLDDWRVWIDKIDLKVSFKLSLIGVFG